LLLGTFSHSLKTELCDNV